MTGFLNSHLVPFFESPSASNRFLLRDIELVESSRSIDCPDNFFFDALSGNFEDPPRKLVFRSNHHKSNPKVPIPRTRTSKIWSDRARVSQACKPCRELKTKCSGHRPVCHRCEDLGVDCNYSERRREKITKYVKG